MQGSSPQTPPKGRGAAFTARVRRTKASLSITASCIPTIFLLQNSYAVQDSTPHHASTNPSRKPPTTFHNPNGSNHLSQSRLKVQLKLSISRLRMTQQKDTALAKQSRRQMAQLLEVRLPHGPLQPSMRQLHSSTAPQASPH